MMRTRSSAIPSPYLIGAGIGLLNTLAFATAKRGLGVTSPFEDAAALSARQVAPEATRIDEYLSQRDEPPKVDWESALVLGVVAGSFLSARSGSRPSRAAIPALWKRRFGPSRAKRYGAAFLGGAVMMFGARMAKGCTSGHGITGTMQLAVSSWVFTPLMFAAAALTTRALYGKEV